MCFSIFSFLKTSERPPLLSGESLIAYQDSKLEWHTTKMSCCPIYQGKINPEYVGHMEPKIPRETHAMNHGELTQVLIYPWK
jgi:hypothetical protein